MLLSFLLATLLQLFFWSLLFSRLAFYKEKTPPKTEQNDQPSVSIVICARNEAENLLQNLPRILNQTYRSFEIIVVNHNSTDKTLEILEHIQKKCHIFRIVNLSHINKVGKKHALSEGIKAAKHEIVLLTDADCAPSSPFWLQKMQQPIRGNLEIGLGYGPYFERPGFLNKIIRFETVYAAVQYFSFALAGQPYMGVGRNLIYRKSLFFKANGFHEHEHIASGDDDLFINQVARKQNVRVVLNRQTFVYSEPKRTWKAWYRQKTRHLTTATEYKWQHQTLLGLLSVSHFWHYAAGLVLLLMGGMSAVVLLCYLVRIGLVWLLYGRILKRFHEQNLLIWIPILDAAFVGYYIVFVPSLFTTRNTYTWK